jgi:hypothetical protein
MRTWCLAVLLLSVACGPREPRPHQLRLYSKSYHFTVVAQPSPPRAREDIQYKIVILDRESRQPIESGEGQIFANDSAMARTWDGFSKGPELGTYYGKLNYVTSGLWAVAIRFRRDSLHPLEKIEWMQDVYNERGQATTP